MQAILAFVLVSPSLFFQQLPETAIHGAQDTPASVREVQSLATTARSRINLTGSDAPAFSVKSMDGASHSLASLKGKTILLDFWTSWCGPCRQAMPCLEAMNRGFSKQGLVILGIDVGERREIVEAFLEKTPASYPTVLGIDSDVVTTFHVTAYPTYVLINPSGKIVAHQIGYSNDAALRSILLRAGFNVPPPATMPGYAVTPQKSPEVTAYTLIGAEKNAQTKKKLILDFEKNYPKSNHLPELYIELSRALVSQSDFTTAQQFAEKAVTAVTKLKNGSTHPDMSERGWHDWINTLEGSANSNLAWVKQMVGWQQQQLHSTLNRRR